MVFGNSKNTEKEAGTKVVCNVISCRNQANILYQEIDFRKSMFLLIPINLVLFTAEFLKTF